MDVKESKRKAKHDSKSEHKRKKRKRHSSTDSSSDVDSSPPISMPTRDVNSQEPYTFSESDLKRGQKEVKRQKKEKKLKHKKDKAKKKKKSKPKKHKHKARMEETGDRSKQTKESSIEPLPATVEPLKVKRVMAPMTKEEYEKQQSVMKHVLDPETGRYRLIKGDGEVMEEIVSHSRHREINKQSTKGDGAAFQRMLGLG